MKELSLNILDIAKNSTAAGSKNVKIEIDETEEALRFIITDDGCGMTKEFLESVTNPFATTRKTRKVGLGIPFLKLEAEMTGGSIDIKSKKADENDSSHGTATSALFYKKHIDYIPLGDIVSTICTLVGGSPNIDFLFVHKMPDKSVCLDTKEMREQLGEIPLDSPEVLCWMREYLTEQYNNS